MKLKLSYTEFKALHDLLQGLLFPNITTGIKGRLLRAMLLSIFKKFYVKMLDERKKKYSITLKEEYACAWWLFFSEYQAPTPYEANLVAQINNSIHQKYSV